MLSYADMLLLRAAALLPCLLLLHYEAQRHDCARRAMPRRYITLRLCYAKSYAAILAPWRAHARHVARRERAQLLLIYGAERHGGFMLIYLCCCAMPWLPPPCFAATLLMIFSRYALLCSVLRLLCSRCCAQSYAMLLIRALAPLIACHA